MANNSSQCILLLYEMVETMTIANGYNYDWVINKGGDKFFKASTKPKMTIRMGPENNVDDGGAKGSNQYIDDLDFVLTAKIALSTADLQPQEIDYEQDRVLSLMRDDIKKRYSSASYLCDARRDRAEIIFRARHLSYNGSDPRIEETEAKFSTMRIDTNITVKYESERF